MSAEQFLLKQNQELREQRSGLTKRVEDLSAENAKLRDALDLIYKDVTIRYIEGQLAYQYAIIAQEALKGGKP